ncbi:MAG: pyruvate, phosphate dikinase [Gammaproteobacteria bacterium]|nr:MAG: pyruvate, phosphate dikinase [Gammaproteobacteria bacterium]
MLYPQLDPAHNQTPLAQGLSASPGAASGIVVFDADRAQTRGKAGEKVILVREETKPEDIHGFFASQGILTSRGGKTSHAAVVARGMGKPCVAGAEGISVDVFERKAEIGDRIINEGDVITIDGSTGNVYAGEISTVEPEFTDELNTLLAWADDQARLSVRANADTPEEAARARRFGATGIGLCRTERMFNATDRLPIVVEMIMAEDKVARQEALDRLLPIQRDDFYELFKVMSPHPVTVRLLDPPIHEFLPSEQQLVNELASLRNVRDAVDSVGKLPDALKMLDPQVHANYSETLENLHESLEQIQGEPLQRLIDYKDSLLRKVRVLYEVNPMLGHRGVRLGITYPEIYEMQIRAILEAAARCVQEGIEVNPEVMVPQVCTAQELKYVKDFVDALHPQVEAEFGVKVQLKFGTMIEVVRACMRASQLANAAEFFSFGTNDLSQATFSFSREDAENKFLPFYNENGILQDNPFEVLDVKGVGRLMEFTVEQGRKSREDLKVGICGEQGGHPYSIGFCHSIGLDYVSCSGPRVPIARLAAAQVALTSPEFNYD